MVAGNGWTVEQFLQWWLAQKQEEGISYKTRVNYEAAVKRTADIIGHLRVDAVTCTDIKHVVHNARVKSGVRTSEQTRSILHNAFEDAIELECIGSNPVKRNRKNKKRLKGQRTELRKVRKTLDLQQVATLISGTKDDWYHALYVLAVTAGLRHSELLGLSWADVNLSTKPKKDLPARHVHVGKQQQRETGRGLLLTAVKTDESERTIPLYDVAVAALETHRNSQSDEFRKLGIPWRTSGRVFTSRLGTPLDPANVRRHFYAALERLKLPRVTVHELRHTAASVMAMQGIPVHVAQRILGHAKPSTTQDIYTHATDTDIRTFLPIMNAAYSFASDEPPEPAEGPPEPAEDAA